MLVAIGLAFVAGLITAISPCVLPVLPIVLAGGASGGRRRPYAIIAGLASCFLVSILFASWILSKLGLPQDLLRNISIGLLFLLAATLLFPQLGVLLERPFTRLSRGPSGDLGSWWDECHWYSNRTPARGPSGRRCGPASGCSCL